MAGKFRTQADKLIDLVEQLAGDEGWRIKSTTRGETEGGAGRVTVVFVPALDGDESLNGTPMGAAVNGHAETQFAAPRAHRPGAEAE